MPNHNGLSSSIRNNVSLQQNGKPQLLPWLHNSTPGLNKITLSNTTSDSLTMQPSFRQISDEDSLEDDTHLHKTAVIIIMSILIFISLTISAAVLVFCKKKNSVFSYQKSEHADKDYEYEMDDINTENESSDSMETTEPIRSQTYPSIADVNSSSNKIRYKFIPKSNTFSGIEYCGLDMTREHSNNFSLSNSLYSSSSPSLNFQSLTIKVDVEPCLQSQSSECLTDYSMCNDNSSTYMTEHEHITNSHSAERFNSAIPWDYDSNSLENDELQTTLILSKNPFTESTNSSDKNLSISPICSMNLSHEYVHKKSQKKWVLEKQSSEESDELFQISKPLLHRRGDHSN
ncbi:unnamed protein product [Mytilus coruscus]|uniref:Uncharacterized protein n=1 Tax=Mytilus coruscus TaxID=42192 RepID=A0A6J8B0C5_MYTCO|nr:unnamed protein product [Mytilus coruscus]